MSDHENDHGDIRYKYMQVGYVVDRADPLAIGRVRVCVPGLIEKSGWCFPMGMPGGGTAQRGFKFVPRMNAEVCVFFKGGDPDAPYYMPAQWGTPGGKSEAPGFTSNGDAGPNPEDVDIIETDRYLIEIDNRAASAALRFTDKNFPDTKIEFDGGPTGPGITIEGTAAIVLNTLGIVSITGSVVTINGRPVSDGSQPI